MAWRMSLAARPGGALGASTHPTKGTQSEAGLGTGGDCGTSDGWEDVSEYLDENRGDEEKE